MERPKPSLNDLLEIKLDTLLGQWPEASRALLANKMACIGCDFAKFHSALQALKFYKLETGPFMQDLKEAIANQPGAPNTHMEKE